MSVIDLLAGGLLFAGLVFAWLIGYLVGRRK